MNPTWQLEVKDSRKSTNWKMLWEFAEEQCANYRELVLELNEINAPIQFRIEKTRFVNRHDS